MICGKSIRAILCRSFFYFIDYMWLLHIMIVMQYLLVRNLYKSFTGKPLIDGVEFSIYK